MDFITKIINLIDTPQITWAMIFATLGYFSKTLIDYYVQKRKTIDELQFKAMLEKEREQENVRVSILSQILLVRRDINSIHRQFLGRAEDQAILIKDKIEEYDEIKKEFRFDYSPTSEIMVTTTGLSSLLAQINGFRTYQYLRVQAQFSDVDLLQRIDELEEVLSGLGIYREYQNKLASFALRDENTDWVELIKSKKRREKAPLFLATTVSWAEKFIFEFINAWLDLINQESTKQQATLAELGIDLSSYMEDEFRRYPKDAIKPDVSHLQISNESAEFVRVLINFDNELQKVFKNLDESAKV